MSDDYLGDLHAALPERPDDQTAAALAEATTWVGSHGVEAVGLGETDDGSPCVVVLTSGSAADLPEVVGGLPVRAEATGPIQALNAEADPPADADAGG